MTRKGKVTEAAKPHNAVGGQNGRSKKAKIPCDEDMTRPNCEVV